jgi:AbrB family looped-hinge helix DNA binding protein
MQTVISSKFQTTIPKKIREQLSLSVSDFLEWEVEDGRIIVTSPQADFLKYKNSVHVGAGDIEEDIRRAGKKRSNRYVRHAMGLVRDK